MDILGWLMEVRCNRCEEPADHFTKHIELGMIERQIIETLMLIDKESCRTCQAPFSKPNAIFLTLKPGFLSRTLPRHRT